MVDGDLMGGCQTVMATTSVERDDAYKILYVFAQGTQRAK
jgi:hypothetical protein